MKSIFLIFSMFALLMLGACSNEYGSSDLSVSDSGKFVERGTNDALDGSVVITKDAGASLVVEFEQGYPNGRVEMQNSEGEVVLNSSFVPDQNRELGGGFGSAFINETLEKGAANLATDDYLSLFKEFSKFDGDYFEIDGNSKKIEGQYDAGERMGRWQIYCKNGQLESDRTYARKTNEAGSELTIEIGDARVNTCDGDVLLSAQRDSDGKLVGAYIENTKPWGKDVVKPLPKYVRNYVQGELDGEQKEYDRNGQLKVENIFSNGVKNGLEKIYSSNTNRFSRGSEENKHWLSETINYSNGQRSGNYSLFDDNNRVIETGQYENDQPVGIWSKFDRSKYSQQLVDYDAENFILEKQKAFRSACFLPANRWDKVNWSKGANKSLTDCEYYVSEKLIDINKKLAMDGDREFKLSNDWTYPAVVAAPNVYEYMKKHGLTTRVSDGFGRTRLHTCLSQLRAQNKRQPRCSSEQAISYISDVDVDSVSNAGTALHHIALPRNFNSKRKEIIQEEMIIAKSLIENGANIDQLNHKNTSALMMALSSQQYEFAEMLVDAGAAVNVIDADGKNTLGSFFIDARKRWQKSKTSAQGTRVLAKLIAAGVDTEEAVFDGKTVRDFSEENNTLHHIQTLKEATAMSVQYKETLGARVSQEAELTEQLESAGPFSAENKQAQADLNKADIANETELDEAAVTSPQLGNQGDNSRLSNQELITGALENNQPPSTETISARNSTDTVKTNEITDVVTPSAAEVSTAAATQESQAQELLKQQAAFLVNQANDHIANLRLKTPESNSALGSLKQLKQIDPQNQNIAKLERAIGEKYLGLAASKINQGDKPAAQRHLDSATQFISDDAVISDYQTRVNNTQVVARSAPVSNPVAKAPVTKAQTEEVNSSAEALICDPDVKAAGVPILGRTFTARQSLPRSTQQILSKSMAVIEKDYSNIQANGDSITFEQQRKGTPLKINLSVRRDGNNSMLTLVAKIPAGVLLTKPGFKTEFCNLISTL